MPDAKLFRAIYGCCKEHGVDNEGLHDVVRLRFNKASLKELSNRECYELMDGIRGKATQRRGGGVSGHSYTERGAAMQSAGRRDSDLGVEFLVNTREMEMLRELAEQLGWSAAALQAFCQRQNKGQGVKTLADLNRVLWGLKAMLRRRARRSVG